MRSQQLIRGGNAIREELFGALAGPQELFHFCQERQVPGAPELQKSLLFSRVGQLAGGLAHDFNNMLMVIRGNIDLARRGFKRGRQIQSATSTRRPRASSALRL